MSSFEKYSILTDAQNGFHNGKNTVRTVYQALCKVIESLNSRKNTASVSIDLSKAFDSVEYDILLSKITVYGIRGTAKKLIMSYLENRIECKIEGNESSIVIKSEKNDN